MPIIGDDKHFSVHDVTYDVIDFGECLSGEPRKRKTFYEDVSHAFKERGWVVFENTPLCALFPVIDRYADRAHALSDEVKEALTPEYLNQHGYHSIGKDKMGWRDFFEFLRPQPKGVEPNVHAYRQKTCPDYDAHLPGITAVMDEAAARAARIMDETLAAVAHGYGESPDFYRASRRQASIDHRLNRYPPINSQERILYHPDFGPGSIVRSKEPGLQLRIDEDNLAAVHPGGERIVVFAGKALEISTAGAKEGPIETCWHRVYVEDPDKDRYSNNIFDAGGPFAPLPYIGDKQQNRFLLENPHYDGMTALDVSLAEWIAQTETDRDAIIAFDEKIRARMRGASPR